MGLFGSFYFIHYTATTMRLGELPARVSAAQTISIALASSCRSSARPARWVTLLSLECGTRASVRHWPAAALCSRCAGCVSRSSCWSATATPTKMLARSLDNMGRRFVVINRPATRRVSAVKLDSYRADTPALLGDAPDAGLLTLAALGHKSCEGVVALSGDDETNLDVAITTALLPARSPGDRQVQLEGRGRTDARVRRPGSRQPAGSLRRPPPHHAPVPAASPADGLSLARGPRHPAADDRQPGGAPRPRCGASDDTDGTAAKAASTDLRAEGVDVTVVHVSGGTVLAGEGDSAQVVQSGHVADAVAFVAATENDTTNLWLAEAARRANPDAFLVALQNRRANASLFTAVGSTSGWCRRR